MATQLPRPCLKAKRLRDEVKRELERLAQLQNELYTQSSQRVTYATDVRPWQRGAGRKGTYRDAPSFPSGAARPSYGKAGATVNEIARLQASVTKRYAKAERLWQSSGCPGQLALAGARNKKTKSRRR